jgi:putative transposase
MGRLVLTDAQWAKMAPHCLGKPSDPGRSGGDNRLFVEAVLWIVRTGSPWRDLPEVFGPWNSVFRRFSRWSAKGVWYRIFAAMADDGDFEYLVVDSTIVRAHPASRRRAAPSPPGSRTAAIAIWRGCACHEGT